MKIIEEAKIKHYIVSNRTEQQNHYYAYCKAHNQPFIMVRKKKKYAKVSMDFISTGHYAEMLKLDKKAQKEINIAFSWICLPSKGNPAYFHVGPTVQSCSRVPNELSEKVATMLWNMSEKHSVDRLEK